MEVFAHFVEDLEALFLQFLELPHGHGRGAHIGLVLVASEHVLLVIGRNNAVDDLINRGRSRPDSFGALENFAHGHRTARNGEHHVLQAVLNALADLDFALARKQLHRSHLAHVDAHRIGRAAEFALNGGERCFSLGFRILVAHRFARALNEKLLLIRSDFMHGNIKVPENAHDRFDRVFVEKRIGDVVVDFAVGDVAALFAEGNQLQKPRAAVFLRLLLSAVAVLHGFKKRLVALSARLSRPANLLRGAFVSRLRLGFGLGTVSRITAIVVGLDILHIRNVFNVRNVFVVAASVIVVNQINDAAVVGKFVRIIGLFGLFRRFFLGSRPFRRLCRLRRFRRLGGLPRPGSLGGLFFSLGFAFTGIFGRFFSGFFGRSFFNDLLHARLAGFFGRRVSFLRLRGILRLHRLFAGGCLFFLSGNVFDFFFRDRLRQDFSRLHFLSRSLLLGGLSQTGRSAGLFRFNRFNGKRKARSLELRRRLCFLLAVFLRARFDRYFRNDILLCLFSHRHVPLLRPFAAEEIPPAAEV